MKKPLIIFGLSNIAEVAYDYFTHDSEYEVVAFTADKNFIQKDQQVFCGLPVVEFDKITEKFNPELTDVFIAVGSKNLNRLRFQKMNKVKQKGYSLASYISSKAFIWHDVTIGEHVFILENNTIQPGVNIGNNVFIWSHNHIGHASSIEDNVFISSQVVISGHCKIGKNSFLGVNSSVADNVVVNKDNFIGMGVCIATNTGPDLVFRGLKAKFSKVPATKVFKAH